MKKQFKVGQKFKDWTLVSYLGGGGNGEVWTCVNSKKETGAIKLLKKIKSVPYRRFIDETIVVEKNSDINGIIPIIDKHLPEKLGIEVPFFVMPVASSAEIKLFRRSLTETVEAVIQLAETLSKLHSRKIFHRDIKPPNILFYDSRFVLADFGLVVYPNKEEISLKNEEIGAKWTMDPEMKRNSSTADPSKADVYSLAKTFWILLTGISKGFDGQYSKGSIIELKGYFPRDYTTPIDNLLTSCTDNDPLKRPSIDEFIESLKNWKILEKNFHKKNQEQWIEIQEKLFPTSIPKRVIWEDINDIIAILRIASSYEFLNHVFLPNGGGLDLKDVRLSNEQGCIELDFELIDIIKPKRLLFESFGYNHEWNYFRLEADILESINDKEDKDDGPIKKRVNDFEVVSELSPGNYYPREILDEREIYEGDYLITGFSRQVRRWRRGNFVIFCKRSVYNLTPETYDGRHDKMTTDQFRDYIEQAISAIRSVKKDNFVEEEDREVKRAKHIKKVNDYVEEMKIYRCGYCGGFVDSGGVILEGKERDYNIKVFEKFGSSVVAHVHGYCCEDRW